MSMEMKIAKITDTAMLPTQGSVDAAGWDLYADMGGEDNTISIAPKCSAIVHSGVIVAIPKGYFGGVYARSGLAIKQGMRPSNCVGVIDSDYRGEVLVSLYNDSDKTFIVEHGMRIAQLIIQKFEEVALIEVSQTELDTTERGQGGLGSTGMK